MKGDGYLLIKSKALMFGSALTVTLALAVQEIE